jgi:exodeoxyribonuclease VII large subunit
MNLSGLEPTYAVSQLCAEVRDVLGSVFPSVWVAGEVQRLRFVAAGHVYFELVEKGASDAVVGRLDGVIWRTEYQRLERQLRRQGVQLAEGQAIRLRGSLDFYAPAGKLQLVVRDIDPVFALGELARRRQQTLAALAAAGLVERNRSLPLADLPLSVALVTSRGSAAYQDLVTTLRDSGFAFRVTLFHASVQGPPAERELLSALWTAGAYAAGDGLDGRGFDCIVLVRGGGAKTDLAVFDSRAVAEAVARSPLPVLTGLGHEIDQSVVDLVAHTNFKTPTAVGEFLVSRLVAGEQAVATLVQRTRQAAGGPLRHGHAVVERARRGVRLGAARLAAAGSLIANRAERLARGGVVATERATERLRSAGRRLTAQAPRTLRRAQREPDLLAGRLAGAASGQLRREERALLERARLFASLSPAAVLGRGFSITRTASGRLVRAAASVERGELLVTELQAGSLHSRVEARTDDTPR